MKLTVSNFQIHKAKTLEIPENETTFLEGDSDIGKSSLFRALRWTCENKPDGGSFVTIGSPRGTVSTATLDVEPGLSITRERGKSKNSYSMNDVKFEAFGRSVPAPIAAALNLSPYAFQCQGEPPFLVGMTPTEAAKILTEACGLGVIDIAVQSARNLKTGNDANLRKSEILLASAQERQEAARLGLPLADMLEATAALSDACTGLQSRVTGIADLIDSEPSGIFAYLHGLAEAILKAKASGAERKMLDDMAASLRAVLSSTPREQAYVLVGIGEAILMAQAIAVKRRGLSADRGVMRFAIDLAPIGATAKLDGIAQARHHGYTAECEVIALEKMQYTLQRTLSDAPYGVSIDTTELKQQRGQIKVCPTCGRAL